MINNFFILRVILVMMLFQSCKFEGENYFIDNDKVNKLCLSFKDTFNAENFDFQVGIKHKNSISYSVLKFTYLNVKINLTDSILTTKSKIFSKHVFDNLKNKNQFDKIEIQFIKDPLTIDLIKDEINGFIPNELILSFDKSELNGKI